MQEVFGAHTLPPIIADEHFLSLIVNKTLRMPGCELSEGLGFLIYNDAYHAKLQCKPIPIENIFYFLKLIILVFLVLIFRMRIIIFNSL